MTCEDNSRSRLVTGWSRVGSAFSLSFQLGCFSQVTVGHGLVTAYFSNICCKLCVPCILDLHFFENQNKSHVTEAYTHSKHASWWIQKRPGPHVRKSCMTCEKSKPHVRRRWIRWQQRNIAITHDSPSTHASQSCLTFFPPKVPLASNMLLKVNCAGLRFESHVNIWDLPKPLPASPLGTQSEWAWSTLQCAPAMVKKQNGSSFGHFCGFATVLRITNEM